MPLFHFNTSELISHETTLKINSNKFEGSLAVFPSNVNHLDLSDNLLSGDLPQTGETMNLSLHVVNLSKNRFTGNIPVDLCEVPNIKLLDLSQNKLSGRLPECLGNLSGLLAMDLSKNTIIGVVPSSLGSLTQLTTLHLHNNRLEGNLPLSLQNLTRLVTMDIGYNFLEGNIPFWIGENLLKLIILNLQSNKFTGKIPLHFCQLNALRYLNLAQNNIIGTIPPCFANLSGMITDQGSIEYNINYNYEENIRVSIKGIQLVYTKTINFLISLDLSSNNITGEIPDALMNLVGLKNLNLSRNQLKGRVPMRIGNLNQMESLDLSMNMLSGQIPQSLTTLNFLGYLNMSFNNLSGPIPIGNQLQTLADPSVFQGNDELCGPPLSRSCTEDISSYNHVVKVEAQDEDEDFWLYIGMGAAVVFAVVRGRQAVFVEPLSLSCCRRSVVVEPLSYAIIRIERLIQFVVVISVCIVEMIDWRKLWNRLLWEVIYQQHPYITTVDPALILNFHGFTLLEANGWSRRWFVLNEKTGKKTEQEKLEKLAKQTLTSDVAHNFREFEENSIQERPRNHGNLQLQGVEANEEVSISRIDRIDLDINQLKDLMLAIWFLAFKCRS
ncbi:hypothetical protein R6Q59_030110 [Mikania micrantha]